MRDLTDAFAAIDAANSEDPTEIAGQPLALVQGRRGTEWLSRLDQSPTPELALAVRAHHLRRWEIVRADFADGRAGYLRWRSVNKRHQGESLASIMGEHGWPSASIGRVRELLARTALGNDRETQTLEDAACLVFLETQFTDIVERLERDRVVSIVAKTLTKMSPEAIELASSIELPDETRTVLSDAVGSVANL